MNRVSMAWQSRVAGLQRLAFAAFEQGKRTWRHVDRVPTQDVQRVLAGARVGHRRARGDIDRIVTGDVGQQQVDHPRRPACRSQSPALDGRQVPAHAVHVADAGATGQQGTVERLLVGQGEAGQRQRQQRRPTARDQTQHEVVRSQALDGLQEPPRRRLAGCIGYRVRCLDDVDALAAHRVAVSRHDQTRERSMPVVFDSPRHRGRGLTGADHHQPTRWRIWQVAGDAPRRLRCGDGRIEHGAQQPARLVRHHDPPRRLNTQCMSCLPIVRFAGVSPPHSASRLFR